MVANGDAREINVMLALRSASETITQDSWLFDLAGLCRWIEQHVWFRLGMASESSSASAMSYVTIWDLPLTVVSYAPLTVAGKEELTNMSYELVSPGRGGGSDKRT